MTVTVVMTRRGAADVVVATEGGGLLAEPEGAAVPVLLSSSSGADRPLVGAVAPERNRADDKRGISSRLIGSV